jgi:hypothetical protein
MNAEYISSTVDDTDVQEQWLNSPPFAVRDLSRRLPIMKHMGFGTSLFTKDIMRMVQRGHGVGYFVNEQRPGEALLLSVNASGFETLHQQSVSATLIQSQRERSGLQEAGAAFDVQLIEEPPRVDLGAVPTVVETAAENLLNRLSGQGIDLLLDAIRQWIADHRENVQRARILHMTDPEDIGWTELVVEIRVDVDTEVALQLWAELGVRLDTAKEALSEDQAGVVNSSLGVHLVWDEEEEDES